MKFLIPFLMAMLPVGSVAQSQSAAAAGVPSVAISENHRSACHSDSQEGRDLLNKSWLLSRQRVGQP
jgi:hypothetical protein